MDSKCRLGYVFELMRLAESLLPARYQPCTPPCADDLHIWNIECPLNQ